jgi:protein-L-isoaspartate(D-aspartate) O-methyltransferase
MSTAQNDGPSASERVDMIARQLIPRGIRDPRVIDAMLSVPREAFVPAHERGAAYEDSPQPLACGQTISQPFIVARMLELLEVQPGDRVLEVGTGTGYQAALLSKLAREVISIERHAPLADEARKILTSLGITNVRVITGDGTRGAPEFAPYDAIIVAAAGPQIPNSLLAQLANGGCMICPVGGRRDQRLVRVKRSADGRYDDFEDLDPVVFVPLIGEEGWQSSE